MAMVPNFVNTIASRTLAGAGNTRIPMSIRSTAAITNMLLTSILVFGLGLGVSGAALGTVLAEFIAPSLSYGGLSGACTPSWFVPIPN